MFSRNLVSITAVIALAGGLAACDKMKGMMGSAGGSGDLRNAQIDVSGTPCSADGKFSTLLLKDGKFDLAQYQFEVFGDTKTGDVSGHTTSTDTNDSVFVGNCANNGQTSQVLFVYGSDGKRLGTADLTGNGKGLVQSYDVKDSTILVEQNQGNPPQLSKTNYALLNGKLVDTATGQPSAVATNTASDSGDSGDVDIISYQSFHDKLQPYGKWVQHPRWGWSWHPDAANFRPYENGHWEDSDEYGSVWVSADPWGDTPYHYGRWGYDPNYGGWLWVPDYTWGPAWVTWRANDDYLGWFPIPPGEWDGVGEYPDYWASWYGYEGVLDAAAFYSLWAFVPAVDIFAGNIRGRIIDRRGYGRFIGHTRGWGHLGLAHGHIVNRAFDRARFSANFHRGFPGNSLHGFHDRGIHSVAAGHAIAAHERLSGGGMHVGVHERVGGASSVHHESGFGHSGSYHASGVSHSGGYSHSSSGFSRSGGESGGGFAHGSSSSHSTGFSRSGGGSSGGGMFGHSGGGSSGGSSGGGMFGHSGGSSGGGMFGHSGGGGSAPSRVPSPSSSGHSSGGSSSNNHHH